MVDLSWIGGDGLLEEDGGNDMTFAPPVLEEEFTSGDMVCAFACSKKYIFAIANAKITAIAKQGDVFLIIYYHHLLYPWIYQMV